MNYPTAEAEKLRGLARARDNERVVLRNSIEAALRSVDEQIRDLQDRNGFREAVDPTGKLLKVANMAGQVWQSANGRGYADLMERRTTLRAALATVADDSEIATGLSQVSSRLDLMKSQFAGGDGEPIFGYLDWVKSLVDRAGAQFTQLSSQLRVSGTGRSY